MLFTADGAMNTATVGKPADYLAGMAGFEVPRGNAGFGSQIDPHG